MPAALGAGSAAPGRRCAAHRPGIHRASAWPPDGAPGRRQRDRSRGALTVRGGLGRRPRESRVPLSKLGQGWGALPSGRARHAGLSDGLSRPRRPAPRARRVVLPHAYAARGCLGSRVLPVVRRHAVLRRPDGGSQDAAVLPSVRGCLAGGAPPLPVLRRPAGEGHGAARRQGRGARLLRLDLPRLQGLPEGPRPARAMERRVPAGGGLGLASPRLVRDARGLSSPHALARAAPAGRRRGAPRVNAVVFDVALTAYILAATSALVSLAWRRDTFARLARELT